MSSRTITAVYDTQAEAERAVEALAAQGVPRSDLRIHRDASETASATSADNQDKGFWASLADLFVPDDDRHTYAEALRRGSVMVTARVDDAHYEAAADLMETHGAVDLDERETGWRSEGWTGGSGSGDRGIGQTRMGTDGSAAATASRMAAATGGASENGGLMSRNMDELTGSASPGARVGGYTGTGGPRMDEDTGLAPGDQGKPGTMLSRGVDEVEGTNISGAHPENETGSSMGTAAGRTTADQVGLAGGDQGRPGTMLSRGADEVAGTNISGAHSENEASGTYGMRGTATDGTEAIPVVEETLRVGKREVSGGRVRVRSYVVETPVEEQVTLRTEHVDVERRAVDRPVTDADRLFQDRTIEATETSEEAVIAKEARVKEEVVIRKDADQRTETVRDTVRRTEVEVDRDGDITKRGV